MIETRQMQRMQSAPEASCPRAKPKLHPRLKPSPHRLRIFTRVGRGFCPSAGCARLSLRRSCAHWSGCWRILPWSRPTELASDAPLLIVANHVTTYDGPFIQFALPGPIRRRIAVAMSGEMLEDFRHFRDPDTGRFSLFGPLAYMLITSLFNVFPLARQRNFQPSFVHAGKAMDHGFNVLVFPEGTRSAEGTLARFRPGIGLLVKQSGASVLPIAIRGLGDLKTGRRRWFRSGSVEVHIGPAYPLLTR